MSGRKVTTVTITESEYNRLQAQSRQLQQIQSILPEIGNIIQNIQQELISSVGRMEERQRAFQNALNQVNQAIREAEKQTSQRLEAIQKQMKESLINIRQEVRTQLKEQEERLNREISAIRRDLQTQINAIISQEQKKTQLATELIKSAQTLKDFIANNYPKHNQFCPGALEKLEIDLQQARDNLQIGAPEAAIVSAQTAYRGLSELRLELERLETEWNLLRAEALRSTEEILALALANRQCKAIDLNGRELDITIEVNYWTEGKLEQLINEVKNLKEQIKSEQPIMSIDALKNIIEHIAPQLRNQLEDIIGEARQKVLSSQLRINIADIALQALERQGFSLSDATYEGEDQRRKYVVKAKHIDGSEVVIVVSPKEGQPLENDLEIHSYETAQWSEETLQTRANEVAKALSAEGLQVPQPRQVAAADPALRDIDRIRQKPKARAEERTARGTA